MLADRSVAIGLATCFVLGLVGPVGAQVLVDIPMDQQINNGLPGTGQSPNGDAIYVPTPFGCGDPALSLTFPPPAPEPDGWARHTMAGGCWYYLYTDFELIAGLGGQNLTTAPPGFTTVLQCDVRYFQDPITNTNPYDDAPLRIRLYTYVNDAYQGHLDLGWVFGVQASMFGDPPYPTWKHIVLDLNDPSTWGLDAAGIVNAFDSTNATRIRWWGTDWEGTGDDFVDVKRLKISIEELPIADAGPDQTHSNVACSALVQLDGTGSTPPGDIVSYEWTEDGVQIATGSMPSVSLDVGVHNITLAVTNTLGLKDTDDVVVTVDPVQTPVADAGPDQNISGACGPNTVSLSGSGTGIITSYDWSENGQSIAFGPNPTLDMDPGVHIITLTVENQYCATDSDDVVVTIDATFQPLPVEIPMTAQITFDPFFRPEFDTLSARLVPDGTIISTFFDPMNGMHLDFLGGDWFWGPNIDLLNACYQVPIDLTTPGMMLRFTARYYNDITNSQPYADTAIFGAFRDSSGRRGVLTPILYGPQVAPANQYPNWLTIETQDLLNYDPDPFFTDPSFDPTQVVNIEFFGTDWFGGGFDFVEIKDVGLLLLGDLNCDGLTNGLDVAPFTLALIDPVGYATAYPSCDIDLADINRDLVIDTGDVNPFVQILLGGP